MRKLYYLIVLFCCVATLQAQSFSVRPSTTRDTTLDAHGSVDVYVYFDNEFQQPLTLAWEETNASFPQGWIMQVCDNISCFTIPHAPQETMAQVSVGGYGWLKVTCVPMDTMGSGTVSYHVFDANNPIYTTNVTINFEATTATAVTMTQASELYTVTPVPANDVIYLSARNGQLEKGNVKLYDLKGQMVLDQSVAATPGTTLDVQSLTPGMYMLRYESKSDVLLKKVVIAH